MVIFMKTKLNISLNFFKVIMKYIIALFISIMVIEYIVALQIVSGESMRPNYRDQDILLISKVRYRIFAPQRFDVISFLSKDNIPMMKRVIGLPGDTVRFENNNLYINNELLTEYFSRGYTTEFTSGLIPDNYFFVLGDNRERSLDSRSDQLSFVHKDQFIGRVVFRLWRSNR